MTGHAFKVGDRVRLDCTRHAPGAAPVLCVAGDQCWLAHGAYTVLCVAGDECWLEHDNGWHVTEKLDRLRPLSPAEDQS